MTRAHRLSPLTPPTRLGRLRRRAGALILDNVFWGLSQLGRLHPAARPRLHGVYVTRDVPYPTADGHSGLADHTLDIYHPEHAEDLRRLPVVLYVHGGGFRILSKDTHWLMALAFARRGYLVFNVNYRLAPRHRYPAALADVVAAYRFVLQHAPGLGGDVSRLVLAGESAGANLVTALALSCCYARSEPFARAAFATGVVPAAVLPACGLLQVSDSERHHRRRPLSKFVRDRLEEVAEAYLHPAHVADPAAAALADPLLVLERGEAPARPLPPFFIPVGSRDPLLDDSRRLKGALDRLGVPCDLQVYAGEVHAFHALVFRANARRCWRDQLAFLKKHLLR